MRATVEFLGLNYASSQLVLLAAAFTAGFLLAHLGMTTHLDWRICVENALNEDPLPHRPIYWTIQDHILWSLSYFRFLWAAIQGVLFMLPTLVALAIPQPKFGWWRTLVLSIPIIFAFWQGHAPPDLWHDCDRKGSEFGWGILYFLPIQTAFVFLVGYGGRYMQKAISFLIRKR